jgi:glycosyltransferase involved in cell wall biosynthesis
MRFAIDAHAIGRKLTGNETYVRSLLFEFASMDRESDWVAYVSSRDAARSVPASIETRTVSANPFIRLGWDLPAAIHADRPDLLHVQYTAPLTCSVPVIVSVHDVSFLEHPEFFSAARRQQLRFTVARTVRSAAKVLCPSEFSRQRVLEAYGLSPDKVLAVPNAASARFRPIGRDIAARRAARISKLQQPFILCVGDLRRRKNQPALIRAFAQLLQQNRSLPHHLVFAGKETDDAARRVAAASGVSNRIHFLGFVSDQDLVNLYGAADLFVFPSLYEGFGIPILEAMACGAPVACANTSAMPEVADSAALLFDPHSEEQMVQAMRDVLFDPELRARLCRLGLQRAAMFSWRKSAHQTLGAYYEVAAHGRVPAPAPVAL